MTQSKPNSKVPRGSQIGYQGIARLLRERIVTGRWQAGQRLPTHRELEVEFRTTSVTVQNALSLLQEHEFVRAAGRHGSFVTDRPPHLYAYGLVFPHLYGDETRFFRALRSAARVVFNSESRRLRLYEPELNNPAHPVTRRLIDDVSHHRVAGVIMTWPAGEFVGSPLYDSDCDVPRVVIGGGEPTGFGAPSLGLDMIPFFERAVDRLIARGRRKIASLDMGDDVMSKSPSYKIPLPGVLQSRGLEYRPYWHHKLGASCCSTARSTAHVLMSLAPADRPDGLIVCDDNLVEHAQSGLIDAAVRVPDELDVVAHCNWPRPPAAVLPLIRLGFDAIGIIRACTQLIDQQRRGEATPPVVLINPRFEEELPASALEAVASGRADEN